MRSHLLKIKLFLLGVSMLLAAGCVLDEASSEVEDGMAGDELGMTEQMADLAGTDCASFVSDLTWPDYSTVGKGSWIWKKWRIRNCGTNNWLNYKVKKYYGGLPGSTPFKLANWPGGTTGTICQCIQIPGTLPNGQHGLYNRIRVALATFVKEQYTTADFVFWALVNVDGRAPVAECNPDSLPQCP